MGRPSLFLETSSRMTCLWTCTPPPAKTVGILSHVLISSQLTFLALSGNDDTCSLTRTQKLCRHQYRTEEFRDADIPFADCRCGSCRQKGATLLLIFQGALGRRLAMSGLDCSSLAISDYRKRKSDMRHPQQKSLEALVPPRGLLIVPYQQKNFCGCRMSALFRDSK